MKKRYLLSYEHDGLVCLYDNKNQQYVVFCASSDGSGSSVCDIFNYQDREINRLTKMLYTTTKHADKLNEENNKLNKIIKAYVIRADKVLKENQQFKKKVADLKKLLKL